MKFNEEVKMDIRYYKFPENYTDEKVLSFIGDSNPDALDDIYILRFKDILTVIFFYKGKSCNSSFEVSMDELYNLRMIGNALRELCSKIP